MPLDPTTDLNNSANKQVQEKYSDYELTSDEKSKIWQIVQKRDEDLVAKQKHFEENRNELVEQALAELEAEQETRPELNFNPPDMDGQNNLLLRDARQQVSDNKEQQMDLVRARADHKIDQILNQAQEEGRGPERSLSQQFNRTHDNR